MMRRERDARLSQRDGAVGGMLRLERVARGAEDGRGRDGGRGWAPVASEREGQSGARDGRGGVMAGEAGHE